ncbi:Transcription initiation factor TFIID subunit 9 [Rhodotorula kratochvilovae]
MPAATRADAAPVLPRDARLIALILAAAGAEDCEEGVVRMLVEFAHRYTSDILTDSLMYAEHARSSSASTAPIVPTVDDVRLAVQARTEGAQVPKEFLLQLATTVNSVPLQPVPEVYGIRLPPPAQRLTAPNYTLVPRSSGVPPPPGPALDLGGAILGAGLLDAGFGTSASASASGAGTTGLQTAEGSEAGGSGGGLFGDEDEDDDEMEDVTDGLPGMGMGGGGANGAGVKRKADDDDEEYD